MRHTKIAAAFAHPTVTSLFGLRPGLRTVGFRRRATILFEVDRDKHRVIIHGVYYGDAA